MKETEKAYLSGIVDGEGTICLNRAKCGKLDRFRPCVMISNTNPSVLKWIIKKTKFRCHLSKHTDKRKAKYAIQYALFLTKYKDMKSFIEIIYPYLIIKRKQARCLIKFINRRLSKKKTGHIDLLLRERMVKLNRKKFFISEMKDYIIKK